ncbi:DUF5702 domain-containing protein [Butyrivibrio sp. YAB3001]|uniref:DUF5702 domain-containing protein n=1 Tax=Butyrivibrio sp. YAB3001 TaxID=1520812 RepID=UPI0008F63370|nr:DUF5702 domain-containing protein [Butyrivibrio sp. YAB3001]SFC83491.1 hypothetical protein SAMN02910398_03256 [Butyrivibrio sp. YAB3001]
MKLQIKGYITVFLSLSIMIILSLVLALFQGARIGAVRMKTECVADIAMNSVLAEYSRELYDQYGLLMVDTSYGTSSHSVLNMKEHLKNYVQKNFDRSLVGGITNAQTMTAMKCKDVKIEGFSVATDNNGAVLKRQILAYMAGNPIEGLLTDVLDNTNKLKDSKLDTTDVASLAEENQELIDSVELPTVENDEGEEETLSIGNPADAVNSQRSVGVLSLAIPDKDKISRAVADIASLASKRELSKGTGLDDEEEISATENLLLDEYYYEKCSRYSKELEKSALKYQLEYLAFGENSDWANLEKMAQTLLMWREASNMMYLFSCQEKVKMAETLANTLSVLLFVPELAVPIKYSILFAWTFAESISDLHILFGGGKVPLFKSDSTWKLSISNMLSFKEHLDSSGSEEGLDYTGYLRMKLLMTDSDKKISRMMDVIEMDVRRTDGNSQFMLDYCVDIFKAEIDVETKSGYECTIERAYGYER